MRCSGKLNHVLDPYFVSRDQWDRLLFTAGAGWLILGLVPQKLPIAGMHRQCEQCA